MKIDRTRLFDKRVVQRNIRAGRVTKDEYQAWLGELSDVSEKIKARDEGGDDDGYELGSGPSTDGASSAEVSAADDVAPAPIPAAPVVQSTAQTITQTADQTAGPSMGGLAGAIPPILQGSQGPSGSEPTS